MTDQQDNAPKENPSQETPSTAWREQSKVTPKKRWSIAELTLLGALGTIVMVIVFNVFLGSQHAKKTPDTSAKRADYQDELQSNMAAIQNQKTSHSASDEQPANTSSSMAGTSSESAQTNQKNDDDKLKEQMMMIMMQQKAAAEQVAQQAYEARLNAPTSLMTDSGNAANNATNNGTYSQEGTQTATANAVFSGGGTNSAFGNQTTQAQSVAASTLAHPDYTIASGELIPAVLESPIDSDLPGMVRAVTSEPIYAYTGNASLIPAGSRLIGQYSSSISQGQTRVMIIWNRVILPNGITAQINSPGTDSLGMAGQGADSVNRHFVAQFSEATFLTLIGGGVATIGVSGDDEYNSAAQYRTGIAQSMNQTASTTLSGSVAIQPTLKINQGQKINVFVAKDIDFYGALNGASS